MMLGQTINDKFEFVPLGNDRTWRAKRGFGTQNYYGRICGKCGNMVSCEKNCADLKHCGGHSK